MSRPSPAKAKRLALLLAALLIAAMAWGQSATGASGQSASQTETSRLTVRPTIVNPPRSDGLWPGLRVRDAMAAVELLRLNLFIMYKEADGRRRTVRVRSADMRLVEKERLPPPYPDGEYESRWDLLVNGQVIDPRDYLLVYDEKIMNLGVLLTYGREFYPDEQAASWLED